MKGKLGRNDPCWCDSGIKYKRCHLDREKQSPPGKQEVSKRFYRIWKEGYCLHPKADRQACSPEIVSAHTIRRSGYLRAIAKNGHVYNFIKHGAIFGKSILHDTSNVPNKVGVHNASTFRGFCSKHDNELFSPIEDKPFRASDEQIILLGYRAICYELFMMKGSLRIYDSQRDMDKGRVLSDQIHLQQHITINKVRTNQAIRDITQHKTHYEDMLWDRNFANLGYYVILLKSVPEIMCSGMTQATHDFCGGRTAILEGTNALIGAITFSLIATDDGGAVIFTWPADKSECYNVMATLKELSEFDLPHAIIRFVFEFFENTYFSPEWWDSLDKRTQGLLIKRQRRDIIDLDRGFRRLRPDNCLLDDGVRAVDWKIQSRASRFGYQG